MLSGALYRGECSKVGEAVSKTAWVGSIPYRPCQKTGPPQKAECLLRGEEEQGNGLDARRKAGGREWTLRRRRRHRFGRERC